MIFDHARQTPDGIALDDLERRLSWRQLADRVTRLAHFLRDDAGIAPGEHVAFLMGNRAECIEMTVASILAGLWVTPINWHLARDEIAYIVADSGARLVVTDREFEARVRDAGASEIVLVGEGLF